MKIAILGNDSSHTSLFAKILLSNPILEGVNVQLKSIWGEDNKNKTNLEKEFGKELIKNNIEDALHNIDLALVLGRFSDSHFKYAFYAISKGIGVFVDKPVFENIEEAETIIDLALKNKVFFCGGSALRFSNLVYELKKKKDKENSFFLLGPSRCIDMGLDERFDNVNFYGYHVLEILMELIGDEIISEEIFYDKGDFYLNIKSQVGYCRIVLLDNINEAYFLGSTNNKDLNISEILLDGSYNFNLMKNLIKGFKNNLAPINYKSTLNVINILDKMNSLKYKK